MCGIVGKLSNADTLIEESLITRMSDTLSHRGPDDAGVYCAAHIGLGQRRLAIIDLRREATAPLSNEDGTIWVVFNGEIYNFRELRESLTQKGHRFRTLTDTEVIVHLYEEYGTDCLGYMRGMFAFAIWDSKEKRIFAARDRLGKKPFYYARTQSGFVFGSEIKAITVDPDVHVSPNYAALDRYLTYQYVPSPLTAFDGMHKLPAAHFLICDTKGNVSVKRYWFQEEQKQEFVLSESELDGEVTRLLIESVRMRMIADVPLGAFLSGGIDSGLVVALMAQESTQPIKTFSIGFEDDKFNELPYARLVAEQYGTEHHEFIVKPSAADILPILVRHYNEPFADPSAVPTYYVSKMTRQQVTVALTGDGGDESFAGYSHYAAMMKWTSWDWIPQSARKLIADGMVSILGGFSSNNTIARISRGLQMIGATLPVRYAQQMSVFKEQERANLYSPNFRALIADRPETSNIGSQSWDPSMDALSWMMRHDRNYFLPDCLMVKTDIASMANSLEVRCPFLDHKLVEFMAKVPSRAQTDSRGGKVILRRIAARLLPEQILSKPKTGFGIPLNRWLRHDLKDTLHAYLLDDTARRRGLFNEGYVKKLVSENTSGARDWSNRLWALLLLEMWFREFID